MVVLDTSVLLLFLEPGARPPLDPATGQPLAQAAERVEHLVETLGRDRQTIVIPTPVLSEIMVHAGVAGPKWLQCFNSTTVFRLAPFDQKAAIEAARSIKDSIDRGGIRVDAADPNASRGKVKFDRQIVAIARAEGAEAVYSDDGDVIKYSKNAGLRAYRTADLDLPPEDLQQSLDLEE